MKISKIVFLSCVLMMAVLFPIACKKTGDTITSTISDPAAQAIIASDELNINFELDQVVIDAIIATSISNTAGGRTSGNVLNTTISGAYIDTTQINKGIIKITYAGANADKSKTRTGEVDLMLAVDSGKVIPWGTKGAGATIVFNQYEVTGIKTNVALWFSGSGNMTNISGGLLSNIANPLLVPGDSLTDKLSGQLSYTYNDNGAILVTWTWNFNQLRAFNLYDSTITMTVTGDTIINATGNVSTFGSTRTNQNFYTSITSPVIQNISGSFLLNNPLRGGKVIHGIAEPITITYGVDQQGDTMSHGNPYGYKIMWTTTAGQAIQAVESY